MRNPTQNFINNKPDESFRNSPFARATVFAASGDLIYKNAKTEQNKPHSTR